MAAIKFDSPVGELLITAYGGFIVGVNFTFEGAPLPLNFPDDADETDVINLCISELKAYFDGTLKEFSVPIKAYGTDFRKIVWEALQTIPYGEAISYKQLAEKIGKPTASRAVGGANHHNPINIIIPCHRVVGASGKLTGYGGGIDNKEFLLELEKGNE